MISTVMQCIGWATLYFGGLYLIGRHLRSVSRTYEEANDRLQTLWMRSLMINDERMVIFEEACELLDVDPEEDTDERAWVENCFLNLKCEMPLQDLKAKIANTRSIA